MSLDFNDRMFRIIENSPGGEVTFETLFQFRQRGLTVYADYAGGAVLTGKLIGTITGETLELQYLQVNLRGIVRSGKARDRIERTAAGKLRLREQWEWPSEDGLHVLTGVSIMEEQ